MRKLLCRLSRPAHNRPSALGARPKADAVRVEDHFLNSSASLVQYRAILFQSELLKNASNYLSARVLGDDVVRHRLWPQKRVLVHDDNHDLTKSIRRFS